MHDTTKLKHRKRGAAAAIASALALAGTPLATAEAQSVELQILVLSDGNVGTQAFKAGLDKAAVPYTDVDLNGTHNIDEKFLIEAGTRRHAKFQAVVLPDDDNPKLTATERTALARFETEFKIREFKANVWPTANVGLSAPLTSQAIDGLVGTVTTAAKAGAFAYLNGPVEFEDNSAANESWGHLSTPLSTAFTPYVTVPVASSGGRQGAVLGVFKNAQDGREQMVLTAALNADQYQFELLFPGILDWLTYGVHLGTTSRYLAVHVDDVFVDNRRWNCKLNCTLEVDCPASLPANLPDICPQDSTSKKILMNAADVSFLLDWQKRTGMYLDIAFNGVGSERFPVAQSFIDNQKSLRFINHTWEHKDLDKVDLNEMDRSAHPILDSEIGRNKKFGIDRLGQALWISGNELITGEHSGLQRKGVTGIVNPKLPAALAAHGITWIGSDDSLQHAQQAIELDNRVVTRTVPRYPMNIFYNVGTRLEEVDQYNHIKKAPEGSARAEDFEKKIIPAERAITLRHILGNDPRPHYVHQPNLTEDRIIYPLLDAVLTEYFRVFAPTALLYNPTMTESGIILQKQALWAKRTKDRSTGIRARVDGTRLIVNASGAAIDFPITVPEGSSNVDRLLSSTASKTGWREGTSEQVFNLPRSYGQ